MLKKSTYILLSLLLCVPLVFIVYFSLSINTEKPTDTTLNEINITSRDGYEISYSDRDVLSVYLSAVTNADKTDHAVRDIGADIPSTVTYNELNSEYTYSFYLDADINECYAKDADGVLYHISPEDAAALVTRSEFSYLYPDYTVPTLTLSSEAGQFEYNANDGYEWKFMRGEEYADGLILSDDTENAVLKIKKDELLTLAFSKEPTRSEVTVLRDGTSVHFGDISEQSMQELSEKLSYDMDTPLVLEVSAEWIDSESSAYGKATYTAELLYDIPATYTLVDRKLSPGEFTIVKFNNLNDDQSVTFVSEIPLPPTRIHEVNGNKFAFLPIDLSAKPGQFTISVIAGDEESSFKFTVNDKQFSEAQIATAHGSASYDVSKAEFEAVVKMLGDQSVDAPLWDDNKATGGRYKFANPVSGADYAKPAFGTRVIADVNLKSITPYIQSGLIIKADEGTDVLATAAGKVVYAGELAYSGKTVIIDHGLGVLSIYQNLSEIAVSVGNEILIESIIGKAGSTGYIFEPGTKFSMVMDGVYINPVSNYTYGIQVS